MSIIKSNYHTHTVFSDGTDIAENYIKTAISESFNILGFSDHAPVFFDSEWNMKYENINSYISNIEKLKHSYKKQILILKGMEIDFFQDKNFISFYKNQFNLDYSIGAVHYLSEFFDDGTIFNIDKHKTIFEKALKEIFNNDIKKMVREYYYNVNQMIQNDTPDIIAHIDLINKFNLNNQFFNSEEDWYQNIIKETLEISKSKDCILEINCRSKYLKILNDYSPETSIIKLIRDFKIPITINGDIHRPKEFKFYWKEARNYLKNINFDTLMIITANGREEIKI